MLAILHGQYSERCADTKTTPAYYVGQDMKIRYSICCNGFDLSHLVPLIPIAMMSEVCAE